MLSKYIATCTNGEPVNHAAPFRQEDVDNFLILADSNNCYALVRKVILIVGLAGGMRGGQLQPLKMSCLTECYDGYKVDYTPIKTRGNAETMM